MKIYQTKGNKTYLGDVKTPLEVISLLKERKIRLSRSLKDSILFKISEFGFFEGGNDETGLLEIGSIPSKTTPLV